MPDLGTLATIDHHRRRAGAPGKIVLLLAVGRSHSHVAQAVVVQRTVVRKGARRFLAQRLDCLSDASGRGAKGGFSPELARSTSFPPLTPGPVRFVDSVMRGNDSKQASPLWSDETRRLLQTSPRLLVYDNLSTHYGREVCTVVCEAFPGL